MSRRLLLLAAISFPIVAYTHDPFARFSTDANAREYGPSVKVGNGSARTYVIMDEKNPGVMLEMGVALDEAALEGLPAPRPHHAAAASAHEHLDNHNYDLMFPGAGGGPFQFVTMNWNPAGHEPPGVYDIPHFDFHFYTTTIAERDAIVPSDPKFQQKADMLPPEAQRPASYVVAALPGQPTPGVPLMGVHWVDMRTPELQGMFGKPEAAKPFTKTFIYGSWEGRFTFLEPMITRAYILSKKQATDPAVRDELIEIPTAQSYSPAGYYPSAYRIAWDAKAKEYRIALTRLELKS